MYSGYSAFNHPLGSVYGLLGYKLAQSAGVIAEAAGLAMLAYIGITNITPDLWKSGVRAPTTPARVISDWAAFKE
jgi:hypothetical protein